MSLFMQLSPRVSVSTELPAFICGIINVNTDSFYQKSQVHSVSQALFTVEKMIRYGVNLIDLGAESSRPESSYICAEEECERLMPILEGIRHYFDIPLSIDTRKATVFKEALAYGACVANDISALEDDLQLSHLIAEHQCSVILMHKQGIPKTMQENPQYTNIIEEISQYLLSRAEFAQKQGILPERIIFDPGIGFGKTAADNYRILAELDSFTRHPYPLLFGASRKRFIGAVCHHESDRLVGTVCTNLIAVQKGATFLRVHDVQETYDMLSILHAVCTRGSNL